ncbi:hypothetical protein VNO77_19407 [Canavalia gladiata]|uniref:Uncharacterized protein n=1 Tax=Canavalia gladiata TaxID=3824 RepID=A0AAN9LMP9_CANGL
MHASYDFPSFEVKLPKCLYLAEGMSILTRYKLYLAQRKQRGEQRLPQLPWSLRLCQIPLGAPWLGQNRRALKLTNVEWGTHGVRYPTTSRGEPVRSKDRVRRTGSDVEVLRDQLA